MDTLSQLQWTCGHATVLGVWPRGPICDVLHAHKYAYTNFACVYGWVWYEPLWYIYTEPLRVRLTGHCELLLCLWGSSSPAPLSSSKLRLRLKAAASCWAPPESLLGSPWCTLLPCSLAALDSSWIRAWLSAWRCSITWEKTPQNFSSGFDVCLRKTCLLRHVTNKTSRTAATETCACEGELFLKWSNSAVHSYQQ